MRVVLDTNVFVSALISKGNPPDQLYQAWLWNDIELVTSVAQIEEVTEVFARPGLKRFIDPDKAVLMVATIHQQAKVLSDTPQVKLSTDPNNDGILAIAIAGNASLIDSNDKRDMLALGEVEGVPIRSPRDALRLIQADAKDHSCQTALNSSC